MRVVYEFSSIILLVLHTAAAWYAFRWLCCHHVLKNPGRRLKPLLKKRKTVSLEQLERRALRLAGLMLTILSGLLMFEVTQVLTSAHVTLHIVVWVLIAFVLTIKKYTGNRQSVNLALCGSYGLYCTGFANGF